MHEFLSRMIGRRVDIVCGGASSVRGEIVKVENGVLHLKDENQTGYVAIDKMTVVWEASDADEHRAGFVPKMAAR